MRSKGEASIQQDWYPYKKKQSHRKAPCPSIPLPPPIRTEEGTQSEGSLLQARKTGFPRNYIFRHFDFLPQKRCENMFVYAAQPVTFLFCHLEQTNTQIVETMKYVALCDLHLSPNIMFSKVIHVVVWTTPSFLFHGWVLFNCTDLLYFVSIPPFMDMRVLFTFGYCKQCCYGYSCASTSLNSCFQ